MPETMLSKSMPQNMLSRYAGQTVLAVGAHPDDIEIGMGGTAACLSRAGARLVMAVVCVPTQYETRLAEAKRSAELLGGELRVLLNHGCSRVEDVKTYELVQKMDELVRELKPTAVFSHGPTDFHKDHTLVYNACLSSQRLWPFDFFCYYPTSCRPVPVAFRPQIYVDISKTLETKMGAIHAHPSQFACRGLETDFIVDAAREQGRAAGVPYAEALEVVRMLLN
jgi:LmbE family N-acetylglucosaminyl deacetylase